MNNTFLITEGDTDIALLRKLIPDQYTEGVKYVAGKGHSAASSLLYDKPDSYVVLVLDADTTDTALIQERRDFLDWQLGRMSVSRSYTIILFVPTIEALFINYGIVKIKQRASFDSKSILSEALREQNVSYAEFIENLSFTEIDRLGKDQTIQAIIKAVQQEIVQP